MPHSLISRFKLSILLLIGLIVICNPASARVYQSIQQTVLDEKAVGPTHYQIKDEVVIFDLWKYFKQAGITDTNERADVIYLVTSLQGIVNRTRPRLYIIAALALFDVETRWHYDTAYKEKPVRELDEYWLKEFQHKGYIKKSRRISDLETLIRYYRKDISGLALWDMKVPATANAALMAAGCENLLPVSADLGNGRLREWLLNHFPDIKVKLDLKERFNGFTAIKMDDGRSFTSTGSAKNDVYKYAAEKYPKQGLIDPFYMWFDCDAAMWGAQRNHYAKSIYGYLGDRNEIQQNGMYNIDYWVAKRAFILDLLPWGDTTPNDDPKQRVGTDRTTWEDILMESYIRRKGEFGVVGGFPPWWMKYTDVVGDKHEAVPTENEFIGLISSYNMCNDADAAFGIANASFFMHLPQMTPAELKTKPAPKIPYRNGTTYIAFCMMDYDSSSWTNQMVPSVYDDPARGKLPLNWTINPMVHRRVPHAMRYLYEHRTPNDFFGFADDGAGYINPMALTDRQGRVKESGIPAYEKFASTIYKRYNIDYTPFYIAPRFTKPWIDMASRLDKGIGYAGTIPQQLVNGVPATYVEMMHVSQMAQMETELRKVFANSVARDAYSPIFKAYRCIIVTPSMITNIVDKMRKEFPKANVEVVDLPNYFRLLHQKLSNPPVSPYSDTKEVSSTPNGSNGLVAVPSSGGYFEIQTVKGEKAWVAHQMQHGLFLCLDVDDAFAQCSAGKPLDIEISYLDQGFGSFELQYDSQDPTSPLDGSYKNARPLIELTNSGEWRTAVIPINDPRLSGRQNDNTDLRFYKVQNDEYIIRSVKVRHSMNK